MHLETEAATREPEGPAAREPRSLWRVATLAADLDVSERTVWRLIADDKLTTVRIGRATLVTNESRERWLASLQQAAAA